MFLGDALSRFGLAAIIAIRKREEQLGLPRIPIAMLTANTSETHRKAAMESGTDAFISKPLTLESLVRGSTSFWFFDRHGTMRGVQARLSMRGRVASQARPTGRCCLLKTRTSQG